MSKELLKQYIDEMSEEQSERFLSVISSFCSSEYTNLKQVCESLNISLKSVDMARPQNWVDKAQDLGINTRGFVFSYQDNVFGEPMNLNEKIVTGLTSFLREIFYM